MDFISEYVFEYIIHGDGLKKNPTFVRSILGQHIEWETAICWAWVGPLFFSIHLWICFPIYNYKYTPWILYRNIYSNIYSMGMVLKHIRYLLGRFWDNTSNEKLPYAERERGLSFLISICKYVFQYIIINIPHGYYRNIYSNI